MPALFNENQIASKAVARFQRVSARKARLLVDRIRGVTVGEAMHIVRFANRPSAGPIVLNLLKSAVANVDHAEHPDPDDLLVGEIKVDDGPIMYRMRPRARGRSGRIRKRFCHISIKLIAEE